MPVSSSGAIYFKIPILWLKIRAFIGCEEFKIRINSSRMRSLDIFSSWVADSPIAASVLGSMVKSSSAAMRTARIIRSASSSKRSFGSPTARIQRVHLSFRCAVGQSVDGKVAALEVVLYVLTEFDAVGPAGVAVLPF